jgi:hypothetical protein
MIVPLFFFFEDLTISFDTALYIIIEAIATSKRHIQILPSLMNKQQTQIAYVYHMYLY